MNALRSHLKEVWWLLMLRGVALILFGVVAVAWPALTLLVLATSFAVYLIISGVSDIISGIRAEGHRSLWFLTMLLGLAEVGIAVFLLKTGLVLSGFIAVLGLSLIAYGIMELIIAFEPGEDPGRRFLLIISAGLTLVAGFVVLRYPASSGLAFTWVIGVWGLVSGAIQVAMCLSLRTELDEIEHRLRAS